jgi:hypothetical protein
VRAVFDPNVLVAALVFPGGKADQALARVMADPDRLLVSTPILLEVLAVLSRTFSRDREELARVAVWLADLGERIEASQPGDVRSDKPDHRILECAVSGRADAIVTGEQAMLRRGRFGDVSLIPLRDFLAR